MYWICDKPEEIKLSCNGVRAVSMCDGEVEFFVAKHFVFILQKKGLKIIVCS